MTSNQGLQNGYMPVSDGRRNVADVSIYIVYIYIYINIYIHISIYVYYIYIYSLVPRGRICVLARDADGQFYIPMSHGILRRHSKLEHEQ